jgi:hypothetical protein
MNTKHILQDAVTPHSKARSHTFPTGRRTRSNSIRYRKTRTSGCYWSMLGLWTWTWIRRRLNTPGACSCRPRRWRRDGAGRSDAIYTRALPRIVPLQTLPGTYS